MTLLRFWRKPSSKENDSDADSVKNLDSDCSDKSMQETGMRAARNAINHYAIYARGHYIKSFPPFYIYKC